MGWVISIDSSSRWEVKKRIVDRVDGLIRKNRISIQSRGISRYGYLVWEYITRITTRLPVVLPVPGSTVRV